MAGSLLVEAAQNTTSWALDSVGKASWYITTTALLVLGPSFYLTFMDTDVPAEADAPHAGAPDALPDA